MMSAFKKILALGITSIYLLSTCKNKKNEALWLISGDDSKCWENYFNYCYMEWLEMDVGGGLVKNRINRGRIFYRNGVYEKFYYNRKSNDKRTNIWNGDNIPDTSWHLEGKDVIYLGNTKFKILKLTNDTFEICNTNGTDTVKMVRCCLSKLSPCYVKEK